MLKHITLLAKSYYVSQMLLLNCQKTGKMITLSVVMLLAATRPCGHFLKRAQNIPLALTKRT